MITYRLATPDDNQQLIRLTAASGMDGEIALRIDRNPDFFKLLELRGESKVFVAVADQQIIGSLAVSYQQVYVGGQVVPLCYIADFKVAEKYRNQGVGMQLCNELANELIPSGADLVFLNVAKGNRKPLSFFSNRPHVPDFENIGTFHILQFIGKKSKMLNSRHAVVTSTVSDELIEFLNAHHRNYELGNVITREKLQGLSIYTIVENGRIVAAMCLTDTMPFKQNVVTKMSFKMKCVLKSADLAGAVFGWSRMPVLNQPVRMLYIKYMAVNYHNKRMANQLLHQARNMVYENAYSFVSIGLHEKDPLIRCFAGTWKLTFQSAGMLVSIRDNRDLIEQVKRGVPFEDYSVV